MLLMLSLAAGVGLVSTAKPPVPASPISQPIPLPSPPPPTPSSLPAPTEKEVVYFLD